jgi:hypothetical protein
VFRGAVAASTPLALAWEGSARPPTDAARYTRGGSAKIVQRPFAKEVRIALAFSRKFDDSLSDHRDDKIVSICNSQRRAGHLKCDAHNALGLKIEFKAV